MSDLCHPIYCSFSLDILILYSKSFQSEIIVNYKRMYFSDKLLPYVLMVMLLGVAMALEDKAARPEGRGGNITDELFLAKSRSL